MPYLPKLIEVHDKEFPAAESFYKAVFGWAPELSPPCILVFGHDDLTIKFSKDRVALAPEPPTILCVDLNLVRERVKREGGVITLEISAEHSSGNDDRLHFTGLDGNELAVQARFSRAQLKARRDKACKEKGKTVDWFGPRRTRPYTLAQVSVRD